MAVFWPVLVKTKLREHTISDESSAVSLPGGDKPIGRICNKAGKSTIEGMSQFD